MMHDRYPKKAGKNKISSIDVSPYLCPTNSKIRKKIHRKRTEVFILPNFSIKYFISYPPS
tara:strand:+ start:650 stop:829 length:180 start_codon:yes stop_codon:yes gene_type:complete